MYKDSIIDQTINILTSAGFSVSNKCNIRPRSFDIIARKDNLLVLLKILFNIDGLNEATANEMINIASYLNSSILVIGSKTRNHELEDNVIYMRYNIISINLKTLYDYFIENIPAFVSALPGGLYVSIDGLLLKKARININMSLGSLASIVGVTRRTISKYEEEGMNASIDILLALEEALNIELAKPLNLLKIYTKKDIIPSLFENKSNVDIINDVMLKRISSIGFDVKKAHFAPFNAISKDKKLTILTGVSTVNKTTIKKAKLMSNISEIANTESIYLISGYSKIKSINKTVFIEKKDLEKIREPEELIDLIEKRKNTNKI